MCALPPVLHLSCRYNSSQWEQIVQAYTQGIPSEDFYILFYILSVVLIKMLST